MVWVCIIFPPFPSAVVVVVVVVVVIHMRQIVQKHLCLNTTTEQTLADFCGWNRLATLQHNFFTNAHIESASESESESTSKEKHNLFVATLRPIETNFFTIAWENKEFRNV